MAIFTPGFTITSWHPDTINRDVSEKEQCLLSMIELLAAQGLVSNQDRLYSKLMARENDMSTGIGNNIAIPHVRDAAVAQFKAIVYLLDSEIDFNSIDSQPVKLIIFFAIPDKGGENYMKVLGKVVAYLRDQEHREHLISGCSKEELYETFRRLENEI